tara:strand:- start:325 stop:969 length:645 start_codon:yes stop_codon:yes gene_type:complete
MKKIAVLISGSGSNLEAIAKACEKNQINGEIKCVISNFPDAFGLERAKKYNLRSIIIDHSLFDSRIEFDKEIDKYLSLLEIDVIVLAGFMRILGEDITRKYFGQMINLHPSLLPLYPGLNTHSNVLQNKDKSHGISIHYVSAELDAGPIIAQGSIKVNKNESLSVLKNRIHEVEHILLPEIVNEICNENIYLENNFVVFKNNEKFGHILKHYDV